MRPNDGQALARMLLKIGCQYRAIAGQFWPILWPILWPPIVVFDTATRAGIVQLVTKFRSGPDRIFHMWPQGGTWCDSGRNHIGKKYMASSEAQNRW